MLPPTIFERVIYEDVYPHDHLLNMLRNAQESTCVDNSFQYEYACVFRRKSLAFCVQRDTAFGEILLRPVLPLLAASDNPSFTDSAYWHSRRSKPFGFGHTTMALHCWPFTSRSSQVLLYISSNQPQLHSIPQARISTIGMHPDPYAC